MESRFTFPCCSKWIRSNGQTLSADLFAGAVAAVRSCIIFTLVFSISTSVALSETAPSSASAGRFVDASGASFSAACNPSLQRHRWGRDPAGLVVQVGYLLDLRTGPHLLRATASMRRRCRTPEVVIDGFFISLVPGLKTHWPHNRQILDHKLLQVLHFLSFVSKKRIPRKQNSSCQGYRDKDGYLQRTDISKSLDK